jgi:hypothetical protein
METYSTMLFGKRAKLVKNKIKKNEELSMGELKLRLKIAEAGLFLIIYFELKKKKNLIL